MTVKEDKKLIRELYERLRTSEVRKKERITWTFGEGALDEIKAAILTIRQLGMRAEVKVNGDKIELYSVQYEGA